MAAGGLEGIMSYYREREEFLVRMSREGLVLAASRSLLRQATTLNRLAELACSSEAADRDRVRCPAWSHSGQRAVHDGNGENPRYPCLCDRDTETGTTGEPTVVHTKIPHIRVQDWQAEQRAARAVPAGWRVLTTGDPRGYVLRVIPPSYTERNTGRDRHNLESIGVPSGPSGIRW
jgi:hypothetical protein